MPSLMGKTPNIWPQMAQVTNKRRHRLFLAPLILFMFVWITLWFGSSTRVHSTPHIHAESEFKPVNVQNADQKSVQELCASFPKHILSSIQPVLRIGHTENQHKVEAQFDSVSSCFTSDELVVFSDLEEDVRGHQTIDSLENMPLELQGNDHFRGYLSQKQRHNSNVSEGSSEPVHVDGWAIDRFKFLPMVERIYHARPEKGFYVFYETDSYIFWDNMFRYLKGFDPDDELYMGSPTVGRKRTSFANGGPGFVLSRGAIKALLRREEGEDGYNTASLVDRWLKRVVDDCCGDATLGWALNRMGVVVMGLWPMFNPHSLHDIPFSEKHWCQPVLGLHRTTPSDMRTLWKWEFENRKQDSPILYADIWDVHRPGEQEELKDWDNGNWNGWNAPWWRNIKSAEACRQYCLGGKECVQWHWISTTKQCIGMSSFRYGEKSEHHHSGWIRERVAKFRNDHQCRNIEWVKPSLWRVFSDGGRAPMY
ncbi:unnamed protein product [Clonostachys byssicola]|uniref:Uncharacterized protein n=1 Tax=Clonostachys byssicola TaxID=160290 RepID=A0A9N9V204_9HYPO|nr:unnamed protein product [Clonostachys byssicola]